MKRCLILCAALCCLIMTLCGCGTETSGGSTPDTAASQSAAGYKQVGVDEAIRLMETEQDYIILDVRRQDEYDGGHIPGAICIPNESIGTDEIPALPDKDQLILVYCRSGRRSKEASQKLFDLGYTNIVEFGGIIDWTGETVTNSSDQ